MFKYILLLLLLLLLLFSHTDRGHFSRVGMCVCVWVGGWGGGGRLFQGQIPGRVLISSGADFHGASAISGHVSGWGCRFPGVCFSGQIS